MKMGDASPSLSSSGGPSNRWFAASHWIALFMLSERLPFRVHRSPRAITITERPSKAWEALFECRGCQCPRGSARECPGQRNAGDDRTQTIGEPHLGRLPVHPQLLVA